MPGKTSVNPNRMGSKSVIAVTPEQNLETQYITGTDGAVFAGHDNMYIEV